MGGWPQLVETRTVRAGVDPGTVVRCGLRDEMLSDIPVSIIVFYASAVPVDDLAAGLARALAEVPIFGGRLHRGDRGLEIVCNDAGVPMEVYTIDETLAEAVGRVAMPNSGLAAHCEATAAKEGDRPLLTVRINQLSDGGLAIGTSFHHALGDMQTYMLLMRAWSAAVDGAAMPEVTIVEDRDAYLDAALPAEDHGTPSFRLPDAAEAAMLDEVVQSSARANRTVQVYFTDAEVAQLRAELVAEAGRKLSTNDALAAHILTTLRDLDDYDGVRYISMPVNIRPRADLPDAVAGNLLGEVYLPCGPDTSTAAFAVAVRSWLEDPATSPVSFRADHRRIEEVGRDRLAECRPYAFDPTHRTFSLSNWCRFGIAGLTFGGRPPVLMSPTTSVSLPWVSWLVEGVDGTGFLLTLVVPVRFASRLRGAEGRARLHRFRPSDDEVPALVTAAGRMI